MRAHILIILLLLSSFLAKSQALKDVTIGPSDNGRILSDYLLEMERTYSVDFICDIREMKTYTITGITEKRRLVDFLDKFLVHYKLFRITDNVAFIIPLSMTEKYSLSRENFLLFKKEHNGSIVLKGSVVDAISSEPLVSAKINLPQTNLMTATDVDGHFGLGGVSGDIIEVEVAYVGYESNHYIIGFSSSGTDHELAVKLLPVSKELQSVTITASRVDENVTAGITGVENLSITTMKILPAFMGEVDPIRSLTTLPGVSTVGELASGFNVRGGESGQNLVMQDGAIIYNPSHLFGFFSAFNPDMVNNATLYKGGGPANFGSRISSVLDVSLRNGDASKHNVSAALGLISSRVTVEGPIKRNRSSYIVGARFAYPNWLVKATDNIALQNSSANFRDFTEKIFHTINDNNYVTLSAYHGYDDFQLATDSIFNWSTTNFSLRWDHSFSGKDFSTMLLSSSRYSSEVNSVSEIDGFIYRNLIANAGIKYEYTHTRPDEAKVLAGIEATATQLEPGTRTPDNKFGNVERADMQDQRSLESAVFIQYDKDLTKELSLSVGLRYSYFLRLGPEDIYSYDYTRMEGRYPGIKDTIAYGKGEVIKTYSGLEPRLSLRYMLSTTSSIKASYYRGRQYLHLISNTSSTTPQDYWVSSGPALSPQTGNQFSIGYFQNLHDNRYELSLEGFYKNIVNAVDYIEGADITLNSKLEAGLSQGRGLAYGVEALVKKNSGRTTGWLAYTWSRSLRRFDGETSSSIVINDGKYYPTAYDQPHHVSLIINQRLGLRSFVSANFNYSTGRPITIPVSKFAYDVYLSVLNYSARNDYRIPDYHRLDISFTLRDKPRPGKRFRSEWVLSLFNVYSRDNTYSVSFTRYGTATKLAILGSIFPAVNYNIRF